jgi:hypothetical protein
MSTCTSSPGRNGTLCSSISARAPSSTTAKWSSGSPSEPVKWKNLPVSCSSACSACAPSAVK